MERVPLHDREMEISIQYHVMLIRQSNDQILMRCYIKFTGPYIAAILNLARSENLQSINKATTSFSLSESFALLFNVQFE